MKKTVWITAAVLVVSIMCFTGIAFAKVVPIFGAPVYPVKITQPGSYVLEHNLIVPNVNTTAILVQADNVTIDLNGFAILGPMVCTGSPLVCNHHTGTGSGIDAGGRKDVKVYNGSVSGMGNAGIIAGDGAIIESVRVASNGGVGIAITSGTVSGNTVTNNGDAGIYATRGTITGNTVYKNGTEGIYVENGTVNGNTVSFNGSQGISVGWGTVSTNTAGNNGGQGLNLGPKVGYVNNALFDNTGGNVAGGVNLQPNLCNGGLCP